MRNLLFENSYGERRVIGSYSTPQEVWYAIHDFIDKCNENKPEDKQFKSYYTRAWDEDDGTHYDVGSWSEWFLWENGED